MTIAVTQIMATLREAHDRFHLSPVTDESFFNEWQPPLLALSHNFTLRSDENNNLLRVGSVLKRLMGKT